MQALWNCPKFGESSPVLSHGTIGTSEICSHIVHSRATSGIVCVTITALGVQFSQILISGASTSGSGVLPAAMILVYWVRR